MAKKKKITNAATERLANLENEKRKLLKASLKDNPDERGGGTLSRKHERAKRALRINEIAATKRKIRTIGTRKK